MLRLIAKLLKVLNSETDPGQISMALCFSMVSGLTPLFSFHNLLVLLFVLLLRVNLSAFILGVTFFTGFAYLLDPIFHRIGMVVLNAAVLEGIWTSFYNALIFRLARFNNSILMGSLLFSIILFAPLYILLNILIRRYREHILAWVQKTRTMRFLKTSKLYAAYQTISGWGNRS